MASHGGSGDTVQHLLDTLDEALEVASEAAGFTGATELAPMWDPGSAGSLLDQCLSLCRAGTVSLEPVRTLHQMACTGGTLFAKCVASMPNVQLLSEVDPLSRVQLQPGPPRFCPTDLVLLLRQSTRGTTDELVVRLFQDALATIHRDTVAIGQRLVLRDHAHSHYCDHIFDERRPSVRELVSGRLPVLPLVFVRHPLDSYLALRVNGWIGFDGGLEAYSRRYLAFLDDHSGVPVLRYEDFLAEPERRMREACAHLRLPYSPYFIEMFDIYRISGDSGRRGSIIAPRPRRDIVDPALDRERRDSCLYASLLQRLDYEP